MGETFHILLLGMSWLSTHTWLVMLVTKCNSTAESCFNPKKLYRSTHPDLNGVLIRATTYQAKYMCTKAEYETWKWHTRSVQRRLPVFVLPSLVNLCANKTHCHMPFGLRPVFFPNEIPSHVQGFSRWAHQTRWSMHERVFAGDSDRSAAPDPKELQGNDPGYHEFEWNQNTTDASKY